jgi:hypothetical protein
MGGRLELPRDRVRVRTVSDAANLGDRELACDWPAVTYQADPAAHSQPAARAHAPFGDLIFSGSGEEMDRSTCLGEGTVRIA